jgi:phosphoserine phosphatase RsbU/P
VSSSAEAPCVLLVEDDNFARRFAELLVTRAGYQPVSAESAEAARAAVLSREPGYFSCLLTDHLLPGESGLDLLRWVTRHDPTLAGVLMTADTRKSVVEEALQSGAVDFINKPFNIDQLRDAIAKAVAATAQRRQLARMERDVEQVAEVQRRMVLGEAGSAGFHNVCFHPKHQAGGDSFSQYQISTGRSVALMTDVSGHDLKAAFVSAYFQGMVRAMLESGSPLASVFERCNRFLLDEWGDAGGVAASIAACSVLLNRDSGSIEVLTCGAPHPILARPDGHLVSLGSGGSSPLGWFGDLAGGSVSIPMSAGEIFLWTDGLDDLARQLDIAALSAAHALFAAWEQKAIPPWLAQANDDIMVARLPLPDQGPCPPGRPCTSPLIADWYSQAQLCEIDRLQDGWDRSLRFALPNLKNDVLYDLLLCSREAMLNALRHGCSAPEDQVSFQVSLLAAGAMLRVRVEDPGAGHDFDFEGHARAATETLIERHRGLILMSSMPSGFHSEQNGASIAMDFCVEE